MEFHCSGAGAGRPGRRRDGGRGLYVEEKGACSKRKWRLEEYKDRLRV